jgi:malonyl-CoA/methylmalonyl-CoA synthetase
LLLVDALLLAPPLDGPRATPAGDAMMLYTSGTTGRPKGAVIAHDNITNQAAVLAHHWGFSADDVLLHVLPLHHMHGLCIALLTAMCAGASTRMLPAWDAREVWRALADSTVFMAVPTMYAKLLAHFDAARDDERAAFAAGARGLRLAASGSAALPVPIAERWRAIAGSIPLERFGMTEIGVGLSNPLDPTLRRAGCVGFPPASVEARIVGEDGVDAPVGELWIRGPSVFRGYHGRPDATREAFAEGGWFRTGDTVTRDEAGSYKILGRTSVDILKSGGYKLSALEIEGVLLEHPGVAEVAVVGVPDDTWGERVVACVVPRGALEAEALRAFAKQKLASYKCPKEVRLVDALPRNAMGKVQKPALVASLRSR